ncbi:hypothetical protein TNCV_366431 [Trichonephila clavipes]|nr:hypothetical protein TNCV_366431 [Trichonephila clavipes]
MLPVLGKKAVLEWCMKGLIGSSYVCPKRGKSMELRERMENITEANAFHFLVESDADCRAHRSNLNSRRAANPLVRFVEGEERWEPPTQGVLPLNWSESELKNRTVTCMVFKATVNDRRTPRSPTCLRLWHTTLLPSLWEGKDNNSL